MVTVGISDCAVSRDQDVTIATYALGSCIALVVHDPVAKVAGLLHFMLPDVSLDREKSTSKPYMYAETGIPMLFREAYQLGAAKHRMTVAAIGGAQLLDPTNTFNIGKRNHLAMRKILWKAGIMLHHEEIGGTSPRNVKIHVRSGRIIVSQGRDEHEVVPRSNEKTRLSHVI